MFNVNANKKSFMNLCVVAVSFHALYNSVFILKLTYFTVLIT